MVWGKQRKNWRETVFYNRLNRGLLRAWGQPGVFSARLGQLFKGNPASIRWTVAQLILNSADFSIYFFYSWSDKFRFFLLFTHLYQYFYNFSSIKCFWSQSVNEWVQYKQPMTQSWLEGINDYFTWYFLAKKEENKIIKGRTRRAN